MIGALTYGAAATDRLLLLQGAEPATPVGSQAANPIRVRAVAADGVTPVSGATIVWSATKALQFSVCGGASSCSVLSDETGESSSWVTPTTAAVSTITIALAPASYSPAQSQQATVVASSSALNLAAVTPTRWIGQGATIAVPLTVEALNQTGAPQANVAVNFDVTSGTASLSATSANTNSSGFATVTANLTNLNAGVQVSACVAPNNTVCQTLVLLSTSSSLWTLEPVSGSSQFVLTGQSFQPLVMRVTDGSSADDPVMGVNVAFVTTLAQVSSIQQGGMPVLLGSSQAQVVTDQNGLASTVPSAQNVEPCDVFIAVSAGGASAQFQMENLAAIVLAQPSDSYVPISATQFAPPIAAPMSAPQAALDVLFELPLVISGNEPAEDSHINDSTEPSADDASTDQAASSSNSTANDKSASPPSAPSQPAAAQASNHPSPAVGPVAHDVAPQNDSKDAPTLNQAQSQPASNPSPP
jgi:hypothetical protein